MPCTSDMLAHWKLRTNCGSRLREQGGGADLIVVVARRVPQEPVGQVEARLEERRQIAEGTWPLLIDDRRLAASPRRHWLDAKAAVRMASLLCCRSDLVSRASAPDSISVQKQVLSMRFRIESTCSRFEIDSRALALHSKTNRVQVLSIPIRIERIRSRFQFESRASALDSTSIRERTLSIQIGIESICSRSEFESRAYALDLKSSREHVP